MKGSSAQTEAWSNYNGCLGLGLEGLEGNLGDDENVQTLDYGDGRKTLNILKNIVHFTWLNCMMCKLYLN